MIGRVQGLVVDCPDPGSLATFYASLLGLTQRNSDDTWATLVGGAGQPRIHFQRVPDYHPPAWPDPGHPQQMHLDIEVEDIAEAEPRVLALGATLLRDETGGDFHVFADPVGHPFCLVWG